MLDLGQDLQRLQVPVGVVVVEHPVVQALAAETGDQRPRLVVTVPAEGGGRQTDQMARGPVLVDAQSVQDPCVGLRHGEVSLVDDDEGALTQPGVVLLGEPLDGRVVDGDDHLRPVDDGNGVRDAAPQTGDAQRLVRSHGLPDVGPGLDGLLGQLLALGDPQDRAVEQALAQRADADLGGDPRLARPGGDLQHGPLLLALGEVLVHALHERFLVRVQLQRLARAWDRLVRLGAAGGLRVAAHACGKP